MTHRTLFPPPDERRALEQLERLHREIQRARRERERAGAEFEGFVQEVRTDAGAAAPASPGEPASRRLQRPVAPAAPPATAERERAAVVAPAVHPPVAAAATPARAETLEPGDASARIPPASGIKRRMVLPVAATVLIGGLAFVYFWQRTHAPAPAPTVATHPATPAAQPTAPRAAPQPPPAPVVSPSTVRLTTTRSVWLRVFVDGERVLERELPAGQQLTYTPATSIVMRAGDAGALRVKVGSGPEETLGRDGFPATRRISVRPSTGVPR